MIVNGVTIIQNADVLCYRAFTSLPRRVSPSHTTCRKHKIAQRNLPDPRRLPSNTPPLTPLVSSNQKRKLQRLFLVQPRIAESLIPTTEILVLKTLRATRAFRDCVACEFEMYAAEEGAAVGVDAEGGGKLG